mmetsp:Transcript_44/g.117  ORF Transcript_44/g.117 Transcript_44/m.117 type:complete len:85 (+) Transcript_44:266-520(+)
MGMRLHMWQPPRSSLTGSDHPVAVEGRPHKTAAVQATGPPAAAEGHIQTGGTPEGGSSMLRLLASGVQTSGTYRCSDKTGTTRT